MEQEMNGALVFRNERRRRKQPVLVCALALCSSVLPSVFAADQPAKPTLEDNLKRLRYEPIAFEKPALPARPTISDLARQNEPLSRGELASGKKLLFLVDTDQEITSLDERSARGLNTLGELGVVLEDSVLGRLTNSSLVLMDKIKLGRAQFMNQPASVQKVEFDYVAAYYDGVFGRDFLFRNFCFLDCGGRRLYVRAARPSDEESKA